jgi:hypothetical protein
MTEGWQNHRLILREKQGNLNGLGQLESFIGWQDEALKFEQSKGLFTRESNFVLG